MSIQYRKGDLLDAFKSGEIDILVHGCNCYKTMGAGIAKQIKEQYPEAYEIDCKDYPSWELPSDRLGSFTFVKYGRKHCGQSGHNTAYIINAYTQETYWDNERMLSYQAIKDVFTKIKNTPSFNKLAIGIPFIGCGLAGGDWKEVSQILEEVFDDRTIYVYYLSDKEYKRNTL